MGVGVGVASSNGLSYAYTHKRMNTHIPTRTHIHTLKLCQLFPLPPLLSLSLSYARCLSNTHVRARAFAQLFDMQFKYIKLRRADHCNIVTVELTER